MVDTNCDPTEVDYVIPGNDDALRAIRLFASKISDSCVEGNAAAGDKQMAEIAGGISAAESAEAEAQGSEAAAPTEAEEVSMEDVLGKGVRKAPEPELSEDLSKAESF